MLNIISVTIGLVVLVLTLLGLIVNLLNWVTIPIAIVGLAVGVLSSHRAGRNLNLVLLIICAVRLWIGWGII